jgi:hypothetical protein
MSFGGTQSSPTIQQDLCSANSFIRMGINFRIEFQEQRVTRA